MLDQKTLNILSTRRSLSGGLLSFSFLTLFSLIVLLTIPAARAQEYRGTILGQVKDPRGAIISQAIITAVGPQQTYTARSLADGDYILPFVQPGTYVVSAEAPGFGKEVQRDVVIDVSSKINLNFALQVGSVAETVTVQADEVGMNTADASGGTVMDPEKVQNLPLNGRQAYMLLSLTPGVKFTTTTFGATSNSGTRGWDETNAYSISGQPGTFNQFLLNGAPITEQGGSAAGTWNIAPSIDAIQEFKVMTTTFDAQYGRAGAGIMNTILKSGSPKFHGTLYDFWENSIMEANSYELDQQGTPKEYHNQHQFGGTIGGPFLKKNGYFFFSYEGWREVLPDGIITTVPTADMYPDALGNVNLTGYLDAVHKTGIYDPETTTCAAPTTSGGCNTYTRSLFANDTIPASRVSAIGVKMMDLFPAPNRSGYVNNYVFNTSTPYAYNMPIARVDYDLSDATRIYGIFAWWAGLTTRNSNGLPGAAAEGGTDSYRSSLTQVVDLTHTFSPRRIGDIRASFNRMWAHDPSGNVAAGISTLTAADLGLTMPQIPTTSRQWAPVVDLGDGYPNMIGNEGDPTMYETYDLSPSILQVLRKHNLHYGTEFMLFHDVNAGLGQPNGAFSFTTGFTQQNPFQAKSDGSVLADLLLGYPGSGSVQYQTAPYESYNYYAAYIQDDWKVKSNLTFNVGLRWETETSPRERHDHLLAGMCFTCTNPITSQITFPTGNQLPNGAAMANPILGGVQFESGSLSAYQNTFGRVLPKFGFSYGINKNMVVHGGVAWSTAVGTELGNENPWSQTTEYNSSPDGGLHPASSFNNGVPFPNGYAALPGSSQGLATLVGQSLSLDLRNRKLPLVEQYTLGVQVALPAHIVGEATYLGVHASDIPTSKQMNALTPAQWQQGHATPSYLDQLVPNPFYGALPNTLALGANPTIAAKYLMVPYPQYDGSLTVTDNSQGYDNYNGLLLKAEKRFAGTGVLSNGLSFLSSFTWSKAMAATGFLNDGAAGLVDANPNYQIYGTDRPWDFAFSGLYGLPIGRGGWIAPGAHGVLGEGISGWQLDWVFTNDGGTPVSYPNQNQYNCGTYDIKSSHKSYESYLNNSQASCWTTLPEYTTITAKSAVTTVRNPWAQQTAMGVEKKFAVSEGVNVQFKAEAFNLTNTPIFGSPSTSNPQTPITRTSVLNPNQPGAWSGYGTIGSTEANFPRRVQLSLKVLF
ncbi:TonB-dependent receptor [Acidicapsa acidisoli]|uniref:TonB-dependent receptor n=1 Tax=Acidicapsa acidisoli TaxID=1615681 RepID=UPI0021E0349E|nr:Plug and carboxypeptidase regulatory-like domain-containing protein [Acidicapsa acidisoli]